MARHSSNCDILKYNDPTLEVEFAKEATTKIIKIIGEKAHIGESLRRLEVAKSWDVNRWLVSFVFMITIGFPFLGLVLAGWIGVVVGIVIGLISFFLGLSAITKVRREREGS